MTKYIAKWPDKNGYIDFTDEENSTWHTLLSRQMNTIQNRACTEFIECLDEMDLPTDRVPQLPEVNAKLSKTGWHMVPVSGTVPVEDFFKLLSKKQFPVANFIRIPEEIDYLTQPDVFHELFGHGPLLMNQAYADFMTWYGKTALTLTKKYQQIFSRLFWFTIEFGLVQTDDGPRVYGGGILSSHEETVYSIESSIPSRLSFDIRTILSTPYRYDEIQNTYFIIDNLNALYGIQKNKTLMSLLAKGLTGEQTSFKTC